MTEYMPLESILAEYEVGEGHSWSVETVWLHAHHRYRMRELTEDIRLNGIQTPVLLGDDGRVWDGHHRLVVARELGIESVPFERGHTVTLNDD